MNLTKIKQKLKKNNTQGLALDIDETLSWTVGFWVEQLQREIGNPENLSIQEMVIKYKYVQNVPYWNTSKATNLINDYMHSNDIQEILPLIENSNSAIQKINKKTPISLYITARPESVLEGTRKWLKKHNFPDIPIIARPKNIAFEISKEWKAKTLERLYPEIIGIIDDNPGFVSALSSTYKGIVYLYDNIEHPRTDIHIVPCKTWEDVLKKIIT